MATRSKLCRYLSGHCPYGDRCMFKHNDNAVGPDQVGKPKAILTAQRGARTNEAPILLNPAPELCKFHARGSCTFGNACRNLHEATVAKTSPDSSICKYYISGTCKFGDKCHFPHILPVAAGNSVHVPHSVGTFYKRLIMGRRRSCTFLGETEISHTLCIELGSNLLSSLQKSTRKIWLGRQKYCSDPVRRLLR